MTKGPAEMFDEITAHMDRSAKAAARRGYADWGNKGNAATNPFAKNAEATKWSAWQTGYELAMRLYP